MQQEDIDQVLNVCTADLYHDMHQRQVDYVSPRTYAPNAPYVPYRRYLVDWMSDVGDQVRLHTTTIHVSVLFLDKLLRSSNTIPRAQWQLLATACITIAAKYEEAEEHCPHIPDLLRLTKLSAAHTSRSFREAELEVLRRLGWRLRAIPPLHVVNYLLQKGVCFEDDLWQRRPMIPKIPKYIQKYAEFFCNLTLQDYSFQQYLPTELAAAVLYCSRVALQLEPRWRPELSRLTGYDEDDIAHIVEHVWSYYQAQFPGHGGRSISPRSVAEGM
jgi:Cyclin, N-terminal domain/Cyclin, C-terminal domain